MEEDSAFLNLEFEGFLPLKTLLVMHNMQCRTIIVHDPTLTRNAR